MRALVEPRDDDEHCVCVCVTKLMCWLKGYLHTFRGLYGMCVWDMITINVDDIDYCTLFNSEWACLMSFYIMQLFVVWCVCRGFIC